MLVQHRLCVHCLTHFFAPFSRFMWGAPGAGPHLQFSRWPRQGWNRGIEAESRRMKTAGVSMRRWFSTLLAALLVLPALVSASGSAVDFLLEDLQGQPHRLSDYRGKWVLVNYWATWCPPCLAELPELQRFHVEERGRATVLGVNVESLPQEQLEQFVASFRLSFPVLRAGERPKREVLLGPIDVLPTSYLVSPEGIIVARQSGPLTAEAVRGFVARYQKVQGQSTREP